MSTLAIDIDLGRVTAVHSGLGVICHGVDPSTVCWPNADLVLIEVAGPILHHEESHSYRRWMLYNVAVAVGLAHRYDSIMTPVRFATSTAWTKGYSEVQRDAIAGILPLRYKNVTKKKGSNATVTRVPIWEEPHDVRECRCMLYLHQRDPKPWQPLAQYLKELVGK
jgi:hypothetical protein